MINATRVRANIIGFALTAVLFSLVNVGQASAAPFSTVDCSNPAHVTTLNVPQAECEFLDDLSSQIGGSGWDNTGWDTLTDVNFWQGMDTSGGSIVQVGIYGTVDTTGTIPASISNLPNLEILVLAPMSMSGDIPDLSSNTALTAVNLFDNEFTGSLPDISALTQLEFFSVGGSSLTGPIHSLSSNTSLVYYDIGGTGTGYFGITGTPDFSNNILLEHIDIQNNKLSGVLDVTNNPWLTFLRVTVNNFGPSLPDLSNNNILTLLQLGYNDFTGLIPAHYEDLIDLVSFSVAFNHLIIDLDTHPDYAAVLPSYPYTAVTTSALDAWVTLTGQPPESLYYQIPSDTTDTDGDGFSDSVEYADAQAGGSADWNDANLTPDDTDGDGVPDVIEDLQGTDENDATDYIDTDGDLVPDFVELSDGTDKDGFEYNGYKDTDGDGVPDYVEIIDGTDPDDINDYVDTDNGGVPDYIEDVLLPLLGLDAADIDDASDDDQDSDGDGVSDYIEIILGFPADNGGITPTQDMIDALGLSTSGSSPDSGGTGSDGDGSELADTGNAALLTMLVGVSLVASALTVARVTKKI